jgi:uncharacterized protein (TIGR03437 family)
LIYFLSAGQIDAVLPSTTPVGTGTITVANSGGTSATFPIQVVASAFGLLTMNNGSGPVSGFNASNNYKSMNYSAATNPGDVLELWGTGLGPVANDATSVAVSAPIEVDIGGVPAKVIYHGRSGYIGLDQINVAVPAGVSGCNVSVVVVTGNYVSNFGTLPVASSGRTCTDSTVPLTSAILDDVSKTGTFSVGFIDITKTTSPPIVVAGQTIGGGPADSGVAAFYRVTSTQLNSGAYASAFAGTSIGSCVVTTYTTSSSTATPPTVKFTALNAGLNINIKGPSGGLSMPYQSVGGLGIYDTATTTTGSNIFIPDSGGAFTFDNGSGGPDVGSFTAQLQMPAPLVWSNMSTASPVTRSAGVTVNWTGGDASTYVTITGYSLGIADSSGTSPVGFFTCQAPTSAGHFAVPASVLLSLPVTSSISSFTLGSLSVYNYVNPVPFTAPGLDYGFVSGGFGDSITATYQ